MFQRILLVSHWLPVGKQQFEPMLYHSTRCLPGCLLAARSAKVLSSCICKGSTCRMLSSRDPAKRIVIVNKGHTTHSCECGCLACSLAKQLKASLRQQAGGMHVGDALSDLPSEPASDGIWETVEHREVRLRMLSQLTLLLHAEDAPHGAQSPWHCQAESSVPESW